MLGSDDENGEIDVCNPFTIERLRSLYSYGCIVLLFSTLFSTAEVNAHPVTFEDGVAISISRQPGLNLWQANYSFSSQAAIGVDYLRLGEENPSKMGFVRLNYLAKRWLGRGSQGNLYLWGGLGGGNWTATNESAAYTLPVYTVGTQADYETRQFYTAVMARGFSATGDVTNELVTQWIYRIGVSPFVTKSNELQPWLIGQLSRQSLMSGPPRFTLLMRMFYRTALWELGTDLDGAPWLHLMMHF